MVEEFGIIGSQILQRSWGLPNDQAKLDFMVESDALWSNDGTLVREEDRGRWFQEEKGLRWSSRIQLGDVITATRWVSVRTAWKRASIRIVAANADNLATIRFDGGHG